MTSRIKTKRSRFDALSARFTGESVDLIAYKVAKRVFWWQAANGSDETFDEVYARVRSLLARLSAPKEAEGME